MKAAAFVQFFNFLVRLLFEGGLYAKSRVSKPVKAVWHVKWQWNLTLRWFQNHFKCKQTFGVRKAVGFSSTSTILGRFFQAAASVRVRLMCNLSSEKVRLLIKRGFYSRLYGNSGWQAKMAAIEFCIPYWHGSIQRKKRKKKAELVAQPNGPFAGESAQLSWKFDLEATRKHTKLYRIDCSTYQAFCIYLIVWTALFDKRSLPWRSVAEASLVNHERFPGRDVLKSALLNGQTWFARSGTRVAELGSPAGLKNKKQKQKTHAVIGHQNFAAAVKKL